MSGVGPQDEPGDRVEEVQEKKYRRRSTERPGAVGQGFLPPVLRPQDASPGSNGSNGSNAEDSAMTQQYQHYDIDEDPARLDFARVHAWLSETYWSPGIARDRVERAAAHSSLVLGAYDAEGNQVAYLRVISDRATFAYLCDVYVDAAHRGRGLARALVRTALAHPDHQGLRRWLLATADAHGVYREVGFEPLPRPERWMALFPAAAV